MIQNSLIVAGAATLLALVLGSVLAIFASGLCGLRQKAVSAAGIFAFLLPAFLVTNSWLKFFGLNGSLRWLIDFNIYSLSGTILLLALQLWPIAFFLLFGSILRIDRAYLEQEPRLRAVALLRFLAWPACRATLPFATVLTFVLSLNNFTIPALLQTKVFSAEVWLSFNTKFDYAEALRLSWPLVAGPLILLLLFRPASSLFLSRSRSFPGDMWRRRLGGVFVFASIASLFVILLSVGLPLSQLFVNSRTWTELVPAVEAGKQATYNSLLFALVGAALVIVSGGFCARYRWAAVTWLFFLTPGVLIGIALIRILNQTALTFFYQSVGVVFLAFTVRFFALGWTAARASLLFQDRSLTDVISVLGGSRWQQYRLGVWPQSKWVLMASFYLIYLLCLWEVETLILIVPPGRETLAVRVFNMLHYGHAGQVDALCFWMLVLGAAPFLLFKLGSLSLAKLGRVSFICAVPLLLVACGSGPESGTNVGSKFFASVEVFGSRGTGAGQFNKPRSIAIDRNDNFYVVDMTGRVQKFSPDGKFLLSWQMPQTDKGKPKGMACDSDGNIIVVEPHYSRVNHFTPEGKLVAQWGVNGTNEGKLFFPRSVAVNSKAHIYLSEYGMVERIQEFSHRGTNFFKRIGQGGTGPGELNRAEGIGVGPKDNIFEADSCNHRVQVFSPDGKLLTSFGSAGSGPNQMSYPYDVRVDPSGLRFVCEFGNSRVQIFDEQNRSIEILGGAGAAPGQMNNPWSIALDSNGNLYVADSLNHRVQKFHRRDPLVSQTNRSTEMARAGIVR